jgi:transposase
VESEGRAADVVVLGLPEFRLLGAEEVEGELELTVETATVGWCRECGVRARSKGRYDTLVRDVSAFGRRVRLRWRKRRWRCGEPACSARTWTEQSEAIRPRAVLTERARQQACRRVGEGGEAVAAVARDLGTGWHTVMSAVWDHGEQLVEDPARLVGVAALGMDETAWLRANRRHHTLYVSGLVDTATGRLLDVVPDRTARAVTDWLARQGHDWLARIGVVALDPHRGYANAVDVHLGHATLVVDHFHVIRLANALIDDVRRRVQQQQTGHRGRTGDPLYGARKLLLTACEDLDPRGWRRLASALAAGDHDGQVSAAWQLKEITRDLYRADGLEAAREVLDLLYAWADTSRIAELRRFAHTIRRWEPEVLAWHTTGGASNGPTEAVNLSIKQIKRVGRGFTNFNNYRLRLLLHCGGVNRHTQPAARPRGRGPQIAA